MGIYAPGMCCIGGLHGMYVVDRDGNARIQLMGLGRRPAEGQHTLDENRKLRCIQGDLDGMCLIKREVMLKCN